MRRTLSTARWPTRFTGTWRRDQGTADALSLVRQVLPVRPPAAVGRAQVLTRGEATATGVYTRSRRSRVTPLAAKPSAIHPSITTSAAPDVRWAASPNDVWVTAFGAPDTGRNFATSSVSAKSAGSIARP